MGLEIGGTVSVTLHTRKIPSRYLKKKKKEAAPVVDDDGWQCTNRRKLVKTWKRSASLKTDCGCWSMQEDLLKKCEKKNEVENQPQA